MQKGRWQFGHWWIQMSRLFVSGGQSVRASASVLPMNTQGWFPLGLTDFLAVQGTLKSLLQDCSSKALILWHSAFFMAQLSHPYITIGKTIALTRQTFVGNIHMKSIWWTKMWGSRICPTSITGEDECSIRSVNKENEAEESIKKMEATAPVFSFAVSLKFC